MTKKNSAGMERMKGMPFDEFRCFHIKDFRKGDSIRVRENRKSPVKRGVVTSVDVEYNIISYVDETSTESHTTINKIVSLEDYNPSWLG